MKITNHDMDIHIQAKNSKKHDKQDNMKTTKITRWKTLFELLINIRCLDAVE